MEEEDDAENKKVIAHTAESNYFKKTDKAPPISVGYLYMGKENIK